jgi:ATP-dependent DNA ligase
MIIQFDKLYHLDSKSKVRVWWMEQEGGKYRTVSGILDGNLVTSEWKETEAKNVGKSNATDVSGQATAEIEARYIKQIKMKYCRDISEIGSDKFTKPMLAKEYKEYQKKIDFAKEHWGLQIKLNGNRCVAKKTGLFSRSGERWLNCQHIEEQLKPFFEKYPNAILDGEFYNFTLRQRLNELTSIVRKSKNITAEQRSDSKAIVEYHIYDCYEPDSYPSQVEYQIRFDWLKSTQVQSESVKILEYFKIDSVESLNEFYNKFLEDGEEGGILRKLTSPYEIGKRSRYLLKYKPVDTDECFIISIHEGSGNWAGTAKTCTVKWKGEEFDATFKGTQSELKELLKNQDEWIGKTVTFMFNGLTGLNTPNFARIDINNCLSADR